LVRKGIESALIFLNAQFLHVNEIKKKSILTFKHVNRYFWAATVKNGEFVSVGGRLRMYGGQYARYIMACRYSYEATG
jgi:hypothetical protein